MRSSTTQFLKVTGLLAVAGIMALAPVYAKEPAVADSKPASLGANAGTEAVIPECVAKLELTAEQQKQIKAVVSETDEELAKVWSKFSERYVQMIRAESAMLAAIEDNLTEPQLVIVRMHRQMTAHRGRKMTAKAAKSATEVEKDLEDHGVTLTAAQSEASDKIQEKYHTNLHQLHHEIQGLHAQLLALESDQLVQIEKVLTKEQLAEMRKHREKGPTAVKLATGAAEPAKAE